MQHRLRINKLHKEISVSLLSAYINDRTAKTSKRNHYEDDDLIDLLGADTDAENAEDDILLDLLMKNVLTEKEYISKKGGSPPFFLCKINIYKRLIRNVFFKYNVINIAVNILEFKAPDTLEFFKQLIGTQKNRKHFIVD